MSPFALEFPPRDIEPFGLLLVLDDDDASEEKLDFFFRSVASMSIFVVVSMVLLFEFYTFCFQHGIVSLVHVQRITLYPDRKLRSFGYLFL
jgi:hypothetical protein